MHRNSAAKIHRRSIFDQNRRIGSLYLGGFHLRGVTASEQRHRALINGKTEVRVSNFNRYARLDLWIPFWLRGTNLPRYRNPRISYSETWNAENDFLVRLEARVFGEFSLDLRTRSTLRSIAPRKLRVRLFARIASSIVIRVRIIRRHSTETVPECLTV